MGKYKDALLEDFNNKPFAVGEEVKVYISVFRKIFREDRFTQAVITKIDGDDYYITCTNESDTYGYGDDSKRAVVKVNELNKYTRHIGYNPFKDSMWSWNRYFRKYDYDIDGLISELQLPINDWFGKAKNGLSPVTDEISVPELNFNPFVINKDGERVYYQRDYVWTLEDERSFIDSIYNNIDCGKVVIRHRKYEWVLNTCMKYGTENVGYRDIVDGKQRLHTLIRFMNDEFTDSNGYYYSDLSENAKYNFRRSGCITYLEMDENSTDEDVINSFLMVNFAGKPMSKEHIEYVKEIKKNM